MVFSIDKFECKEMFIFIANEIVKNEPLLTEIDSKIGDGDHGIGMKRGFIAVSKELADFEPKSCEDVFLKVGTTLIDTMGGASGVLFGTVFISGVSNRNENSCINLNDFAQIFENGLEALKKRGKAKVGDKTMVDALEPAVIGLKRIAQENKSLQEGLKFSATCSKNGVEYTKTITAKLGRAKYFQDKSIGYQDAGATSVYIIFQAMSNWIEKLRR